MTDIEQDPFAASPAVIDDSGNPPDLEEWPARRYGLHASTWVALAMGAVGIGFIALPVGWWPLPLLWFPAALLVSIVGIALSARKWIAAVVLVMVVIAGWGCARALVGRWQLTRATHEMERVEDEIDRLVGTPDRRSR